MYCECDGFYPIWQKNVAGDWNKPVVMCANCNKPIETSTPAYYESYAVYVRNQRMLMEMGLLDEDGNLRNVSKDDSMKLDDDEGQG